MKKSFKAIFKSIYRKAPAEQRRDDFEYWAAIFAQAITDHDRAAAEHAADMVRLIIRTELE